MQTCGLSNYNCPISVNPSVPTNPLSLHSPYRLYPGWLIFTPHHSLLVKLQGLSNCFCLPSHEQVLLSCDLMKVKFYSCLKEIKWKKDLNCSREDYAELLLFYASRELAILSCLMERLLQCCLCKQISTSLYSVNVIM